MAIIRLIVRFFLRLFYWQGRKNRILRRLRARTGLQDFLDGFYDRFTRASTVGILKRAVTKGYLNWDDIGYSEKELDIFYRQHVNDLLYILHDMLRLENSRYWKFSRQAIYGMERFRRFTERNELMKYRASERISINAAFEAMIFRLLREEYPNACDEELQRRFQSEHAAYLASGALWA